MAGASSTGQWTGLMGMNPVLGGGLMGLSLLGGLYGANRMPNRDQSLARGAAFANTNFGPQALGETFNKLMRMWRTSPMAALAMSRARSAGGRISQGLNQNLSRAGLSGSSISGLSKVAGSNSMYRLMNEATGDAGQTILPMAAQNLALRAGFTNNYMNSPDMRQQMYGALIGAGAPMLDRLLMGDRRG